MTQVAAAAMAARVMILAWVSMDDILTRCVFRYHSDAGYAVKTKQAGEGDTFRRETNIIMPPSICFWRKASGEIGRNIDEGDQTLPYRMATLTDTTAAEMLEYSAI